MPRLIPPFAFLLILIATNTKPPRAVVTDTTIPMKKVMRPGDFASTSEDSLWEVCGGAPSLMDGFSTFAAEANGNLFAVGWFTDWHDGWPGDPVPFIRTFIVEWNGIKWQGHGEICDEFSGGDVATLAVDGNGNLYAGGSFTCVDYYGLSTVDASNIAKFDGTSWSALGTGMNNSVSTVAVNGDGNLYAGGDFDTAGGVSANHIAKWDGTSWSALGSGLNGGVFGLAVAGSGILYAGGDFTTAGGASTNRIAKWDGSNWSALGSGMDDNVYALVVDDDGNLYAGGTFTTAGGASANNIAKWDGTSWSALGSGINCMIEALTVDGTGNLYVGTWCGTIEKWDGTSWSVVGSGLDGRHLAVDGNGNLYAGGYFDPASLASANHIAKWDGTRWSTFDSGMPSSIYALATDGDRVLYSGGVGVYSRGAKCIAKRDGTEWDQQWSRNSEVDQDVLALAVDGSRTLYAGGEFNLVNMVPANGIAQRLAMYGWWQLGLGMSAFPYGSYVAALAVDGNGNLYAGGSFATAGGVSAKNIAKWDGASTYPRWRALGVGMNSSVTALVVDGNGNLYAGGYFTTAGGVDANNIAKWDGATWSALGSGMNSWVRALAVDSNGTLYAGGDFTTAGGVSANHIATWDGSHWSALGSGVDNAVWALVVDSHSNLHAGGDFTTAGGVSANHIATWDGSTWSALAAGMDSRVRALAVDGQGNLYVGGDFTMAGGKPSAHFAVWHGGTENPTSIAITSFDATPGAGVVHLCAAFRSDLGATAVNVYRGDDDNGMMRRIDTVTPERDRFSFSDQSAVPGRTYRYQIGVIDPDGEFLSAVVRVTVAPLAGTLSQNAPNPFNPTTTIKYVLPERERAVLRVYDAGGRLVRTLVDGVLDAGPHEMTWDGRDDHGLPVASGVYFYRLEAGRFRDAKKMVLVK